MSTTSLPLSVRTSRVSNKILDKLTFGMSPSNPTRQVSIPPLFPVVDDAIALWDTLMQTVEANGGYGSERNHTFRQFLEIPTDCLYTNAIQPAPRAEDWSMRAELAQTIRRSEYISPITCAPDPEHRGRFIFGDGEGRGILAGVNKLKTIPAVVFLIKPEMLFLVDNSGSKRIPAAQVFQIYGRLTESQEFDLRDTYEAIMSSATKKAIRLLRTHLSEPEWLDLARSGTFAPGIIKTAIAFREAMDRARNDTKDKMSKQGGLPSIGQTLMWMKTFNAWEKVKTLLSFKDKSGASTDSLNQGRTAIEANCDVKFNDAGKWVIDRTAMVSTSRRRRAVSKAISLPQAIDTTELFETQSLSL